MFNDLTIASIQDYVRITAPLLLRSNRSPLFRYIWRNGVRHSMSRWRLTNWGTTDPFWDSQCLENEKQAIKTSSLCWTDVSLCICILSSLCLFSLLYSVSVSLALSSSKLSQPPSAFLPSRFNLVSTSRVSVRPLSLPSSVSRLVCFLCSSFLSGPPTFLFFYCSVSFLSEFPPLLYHLLG